MVPDQTSSQDISYKCIINEYVTCSFCTKEDAINHTFWRCRNIKPFWEQIQTAANERCVNVTLIKLNENIVILGMIPTLGQLTFFYLIILFGKTKTKNKCKVKKIAPQSYLFKQYPRTTF